MTDSRIGYSLLLYMYGADHDYVMDLVTDKVLCTVVPYQTPYSPTGWAMRYHSCHDDSHRSHVVVLASKDDVCAHAFRIATDVLKGHA